MIKVYGCSLFWPIHSIGLYDLSESLDGDFKEGWRDVG